MDIRAFSYRDLDLEQIHAVRQQAWLDKYPTFAEHIAAWEDGFEESATHFLALEGDAVLGVARFSQSGDAQIRKQFAHAPAMLAFISTLSRPIGVISRLSVHPAARGKGIARQLDEARIAHARQAGCSHIVCEVKAGAHREKALARLGFLPVPGAAPHEAYPFPQLDHAPPRLCQPLFLRLASETN